MATIREIIQGEPRRRSKHTEAKAFAILVEDDGEKYLQIETFGSKDRQVKGVPSQTLRLTENAFRDLAAFAQRHFNPKA